MGLQQLLPLSWTISGDPGCVRWSDSAELLCPPPLRLPLLLALKPAALAVAPFPQGGCLLEIVPSRGRGSCQRLAPGSGGLMVWQGFLWCCFVGGVVGPGILRAASADAKGEITKRGADISGPPPPSNRNPQSSLQEDRMGCFKDVRSLLCWAAVLSW